MSAFSRCRWVTTRSTRSAGYAPNSAAAIREKRWRRSTTCANVGRNYQSADAHLFYARALEESGRTDDALYEYQAVADYYPGAEARVRYGLLLSKAGRTDEAKAAFREVLIGLKRAPKYVRRVQAEWIALAEKALRGG